MNLKLSVRKLSFLTAFLCISATAFSQTFTNPLPIPKKMEGKTFDVTIQNNTHNFDPTGTVDTINLNASLNSYSYNETGDASMTYLGPTYVWKTGDNVVFNFKNELTGSQTTVHWHGLNIPANIDGGPHQPIDAGTTWSPAFPVIDPVQTLWYHSHLMDSTTVQVIRGLAGMIIIEDTLNDPLYSSLPHDYGVNDIPLVIQEKGFDLDGSDNATGMTISEKPGNGDYTLINGIVNSYYHVPQEVIRFRLLNGSPRKQFIIGMSTTLNNPTSFETMKLIASGGGYLDTPRSMDSVLIAVGDRKEFLVDFSGLSAGDTIYLSNLYPSMPIDANYTTKNILSDPSQGTLGSAFVAFVIDASIQSDLPITSIPSSLVNYTVDTTDVFQTRTKYLNKTTLGGNKYWTINGDTMDMMVLNDTILVNTKETWTITNETTHAHPFHIHKTQFQVIEYTGLLGLSNDSNFHYELGDPIPDELIGYKDVQLLRANASMTFVARFDSFPATSIDATDGYMYHCHILTHEDASMMMQFTVVDSATYFGNITSSNEIILTESLFKAYPNPASDILTFEAITNLTGTLIIRDLIGRKLYEEQFSDFTGSKNFDVSKYAKGVIVLELNFNEEKYVKKVVLR